MERSAAFGAVSVLVVLGLCSGFLPNVVDRFVERACRERGDWTIKTVCVEAVVKSAAFQRLDSSHPDSESLADKARNRFLGRGSGWVDRWISIQNLIGRFWKLR